MLRRSVLCGFIAMMVALPTVADKITITMTLQDKCVFDVTELVVNYPGGAAPVEGNLSFTIEATLGEPVLPAVLPSVCETAQSNCAGLCQGLGEIVGNSERPLPSTDACQTLCDYKGHTVDSCYQDCLVPRRCDKVCADVEEYCVAANSVLFETSSVLAAEGQVVPVVCGSFPEG